MIKTADTVFNNATSDIVALKIFYNCSSKNISFSKHYKTDQVQNLKIPHKHKLFSLFHINASSLTENFDSFQDTL